MKTRKILVIDDDVTLTMAMKINLEATKRFEVCVENDALKALTTAQSFKPDIILLDVVMPGMDGGDVCSALKGDASLASTPIIMVTALVSNDETGEDASFHQGGMPMIAKPIRFEKLVEIIDINL